MTYLRVLTPLLCWYLTCVRSTEFYFECLEERVDFKTAQKLCEDGGRNLITIRNQQEETALKTLLLTEHCTFRANWTWRHAWLNYLGGQWLDDYPEIYSNWPDGLPSSKCVKFALKGWIVRKCGSKAATILLCENRDDEDAGDYRVLLKNTAIMHSITSVPGTNGISATFFVPSTTVVSLEIFDDEITVYLFNLRERDTLQLMERRLIATAEDTKLVNVSSGVFTTYSPISSDSEFIIFFIAESDCTLYNVNVFNTSDGTLEPTISWGNKNWAMDGPYRYYADVQNDKIMATPICKEGTYLDTSTASSRCSYCPAGYYQNLKNTTSCKACPPRFTGTESGQTFCSCIGECDLEEEPTGQPTKEKTKPAEEITIKKLVTTKKPTTKVPTDKPTTKLPTAAAPTTIKPITDAPAPKLTTTESIVSLPVSTPVISGQGSSTESAEKVKPKCTSEETTERIYGQFEWSAVEAGQIGASRCFYNTSEEIVYAQRRCSSNYAINAYWEAPDYTKCATEKDLAILRMTSAKVTEENAVEFADNLKEMTNSMEEVSSSGVEATVNALEELENHITPENTQSFVDISSNLLDASEDKLNKSKASLQNLMTKMAKSIAESDTEQKIFTKNVDILTTKLDPNKPATMSSSDTSIDIPKSLTSRTNGAYLVVYKTAKLFKPVEKHEKITVISDLHFSGIEVANSEEEIKLGFEELQNWTVNESQIIRCVFWNNSFWDDYGCRYDSVVKACFCNHATPFTSILSFKEPDIEEPVNPVVWWIEVICFSASIISCIIFIVIILSIRGLRRLQSFKMHCNLAVALLLQYTGYLLLDVIELEGVQCKAIGFLVHWITLACFFAMFAEALSVYLAIVIVFDSHVSHIVVKVALFCWGITGCLVGLFAGITKMEYYSCTSNGFLVAPYSLYFLNIPVLCILLINSAMFGRVVWNAVRNNMTRLKDGSRAAQVISQLKMAFSLNTMLGVGYLIGLVTDYFIALEIIFIIINGLAGLFLLCLFGIFNPMTKVAIRKSMKKLQTTSTSGTKSTYAYKLTTTAENRETL